MKLTAHTSIFLDIIRGLSAQFVLIGHILSFYKIYGFEEGSDQLIIQNLGVVIFFILSGFLIAYSVDNKKTNYGFKDYFIDRFTRIYIAFLPALLVIATLDFLSAKMFGDTGYTSFATVKQFSGNLLMLQDFPIFNYVTSLFQDQAFKITSFGSGRPLWTVAIEWWMYLFFGFLVFKRITLKSFPFLILLILVPLFNVYGRGNGLSLLWFVGVLIYYLLLNGNFNIKNSKLIFGALILASFFRLLFNGMEVYDLGFSLPFALAFFILIKKLQSSSKFSAIFSKVKKPSQLLAGFSFSLYLLHYTVIVFIINMKLGINVWIEMLLCFLISNVLSYAFAYFTEFRYHEFRNFVKNKIHRKKSSELIPETIC